MTNYVKDLYVICNWNRRAVEIITELRSDVLQNAGEYPPIVVISKTPVDLEAQRSDPTKFDLFRFVDIVRGDPCDHSLLLRVGAPASRAVIVLANDEDKASDSRSLLTLFAIAEASKEYRQKNRDLIGAQREPVDGEMGPAQGGPAVIVEIKGDSRGVSAEEKGAIPPEFLYFAKELGGSLEFLPVKGIRARIFAQAARTPNGGLVRIYDSLLSFSHEDCEVYTYPVRQWDRWGHFSELVRECLLRTGDTPEPIIPVGLVHGNSVDTNPLKLPSAPQGPRVELNLKVIAYEPPAEGMLDSTPEVVAGFSAAGASPPPLAAVPQPTHEEDVMPAEQPEASSKTWYMRNHYIICHWNDRAAEIIRQLRTHEGLSETQDVEHRVPIVVLTRKTVGPKMLDEISEGAREEERYKLTMDVFFRPGDPADASALKQVNAGSAKSVVILADEDSEALADARTLLCLLALESEVKRRKRRMPHVVAEIMDVSNYAKFREFEKKHDGAVEVVRGESLRTRILAQAARTPGLVSFYYDLLTHDAKSNELYELPVRTVFERVAGGRERVPFPELAAALLDDVQVLVQDHKAREEKDPSYQRKEHAENWFEVIPVGVWRGHEVHLNPRKPSGNQADEGYFVRPSDSFVVIAYLPPSTFYDRG